MSKRTAELVSEWDSVPFDGGHEGLRTLADREFSGAVVAGSAQLFMLNGTVVGILDGDLETFEDASGTARQAPHDALPLLVVMQARADEPQAQYYTEDTSIEEVDRTLTDGKFTGYVELSENVLSGDYYLVYHQGRSMSVAWVGAGERLITDEEAFDQANGEVGIFDVMPADIEPIDLPQSADPEPAGGAVAGTDEPTTEDTTVTADQPTAVTDDEPTAVTDDTATTDDATVTDDEPFPGAGPAPETASAGDTEESAVADSDTTTNDGERVTDRGATQSGPPGSKAAGASHGTAVDGVAERREPDTEPAADVAGSSTQPVEQSPAEADSAREPSAREASQAEPTPQDTARSEPDRQEASRTEPDRQEAAQSESVRQESSQTEPDRREAAEAEPSPPSPDTGAGGHDTASEPSADATSVPTADLETRSIPSLDPGRSQSTADSSERSFPTAADTTESDAPEPADPTPEADTESAQPAAPQSQGVPTAELEAKLDEREATIAKLESEMQELSADNEALVDERDRLATELEEARAEIERLQTQLQAADDPEPEGIRLSAAEAIAGTNLFVRYHSKGEGTLEKVQEGNADRATVNENLRIDYHTQFDSENASVDGQPFQAFLQGSLHYQFADWLVRELLYEIRDTGHANDLSVLYGALPKIDRAELNGSVSVSYTEDGQQHREQQQFDVVARDRMGNPLVVANINDARDPATEDQMTDILRDAERVGTTSESLAAAFLVTSSFFEPGALETAEEATSSGLFSRDKHKSFVNLSRKGGYHLCLLEARNNEFHLAVPEL